MADPLQILSQNCPHPYLTEVELEILLGGTPDSRYGKLKRLLAQNKLIRLRRGLYTWPEKEKSTFNAHPFELAQHIYAPSMISLESALSFHQLIPESVYAVTSVCTQRSTEFNTPLGLFAYKRTPLENFYTESKLMIEDETQYFMAKPWRALCDYVFCYKKDWRGLQPLFSSLRINPEDLPSLENEEAELLAEYYHSQRISRFLNGIKKK